MQIVPQTVWKTNGYKLILSSQESYLFINSSLVSTVMGWVWLFHCCGVEAVTISVHEWTWFTPLTSLLGILVSLSFWDSECSLDKKANHNPQTSSFLVSALNFLDPSVNSGEFYLFEFSSNEYWGCFLMFWGMGILMRKWRSWLPRAVHSPSLLLEAALNQGRHNMWEACLKNLQKEPVYTNLSLLNSFSSSLYSLIL